MAIGRLTLLAGIALVAVAQNAALLPQPVSYFVDPNGQPLAAGLVYTCTAGSSCPGSPLASFTDSSASVQNSNPVVLDATGHANIWLSNAPYKIVVKDSTGVTISTTDNVQAGGFLNSGPWKTSGSTIYNGIVGSKVCIGATPCGSALAQLNVAGTSSGTSYLIRIDDTGNSPGISLFGTGNSLGAYTADSSGLRLRSGSGASQMVVAQGGVTIQDTSSAGTTSLTLQAGGAQGSANMFQVKNAAGTNLAWLTATGQAVSPLFNSTAMAASPAFKTSTDLFSVNGFGDLSANGQVNVVGADDIVNGSDGGAYKVNGVIVIDNLRNATFETLTCTGSPCGSGGGGGGSPGGATTNVQFNLSGAFAGSPNFTWNNASKLLTVTASGAGAAGLAVGTGYIQADAGFLATAGTATTYNAFQAPGGGMAAHSFTAADYIQAGNHSGAPPLTTGDTFNAGALYWDTGTAAMKVFDGGSWVTLATGGATSPGGATTNVQYNSAGAFAGSANFTWNNAGRVLTVSAANSASAGIAVGTGFVQSDAGFYATVGTATAYNAIQAPGGGMAARSFTATNYIQSGSGTSNPTPTAGDSINPGAMYWNTSSGQEMVYNGSAWAALAGGGGGSPGGATTNIQFNNLGTFGGSANFKWDNSLRLLTVSAANSFSAGIAVGSGYVQADAGFLATSGVANNYNAIQAPTGGLAARSLSATGYVQTGNSFSTPTPTSGDSFHAGAMFFNTSLGAMQVFNGSAWTTLSTSAGSGVTSITGTANQVIASTSTGAVTLSLPQSISTSSTPSFAAVFASGAFNSTATGASVGLQVGGGNFQAFGNGNVNSAGNVNVNGAFQVGGVTAINNSRQFVGSGVDVGSGGISAGNYNLNGGFIGQSWNIGFGSSFTINGSGSFTTLVFRGGILVSAF